MAQKLTDRTETTAAPSASDLMHLVKGSSSFKIQFGNLLQEYLKETDIDTLAKLNAVLTDATLKEAPAKILYTSQSGAVDDADISLGSTSFGTDSLTALQSVLDEAQNGPIMVIWDGRYSISGALKVRSNTYILALPGCGVILRNASNSYTLQNYNTVAPSSSGGWNSNIVDENIRIDNLIINGNGYNTGPGGSDVFDVANNGSAVNGSAQTKRNQVVDFTGVRNLVLNDVQILGGRYWAIHIANAVNVAMVRPFIDFGESSTRDDYNYDGIHIKGGTDNLRIYSPTIINAKDDNIALNSYSQLAIYIPERGPITNVSIYDVTLNSYAMGIGIYSETSPSFIDNVLISGVRGETQSHFMRITNGEPSPRDGNGINGTITVENVSIDVISGSTLQDYDGLINVRCNVDRLIVRNVARTDFTKDNAFISLSDSEALINSLIIDGVQMQTTGGTWAKGFVQLTDGQIKNLAISNYQHEEATSEIDAPILLNDGGTVNAVVLSQCQTLNVSHLVKNVSGTLNNVAILGAIRRGDSSEIVNTSTTVDQIDVSGCIGGAGLSGTFTTKRGSNLDYLGEYLVSTLPAASEYPGSMASATDETGGYTRVYSDGIEWRRVYDNAIAQASSGLTILLQEDFTGVTVDPAKGSVTNPDSANLTISQNGKLFFTRTTDTAIPGVLDNNWTTVNSYAKGGAVSVLVNKETGFRNSTIGMRWIFNGTSDFIAVQGSGTPDDIRIAIKAGNVMQYDQTFPGIGYNNRFKIVYSSLNEISVYYWGGASWTQIGTTQTHDLGSTGTFVLSSNSSINDAAGDQLSYDQLRITDADYATELP